MQNPYAERARSSPGTAPLSPPPGSAQFRRRRHAPGVTLRRRRATLVLCLLNTNETNGGHAAVEELRRFLEQVLFTRAALAQVILAAAQRDWARPHHILAVDVRAASIEVGERQRRVHAHWVMKIVHADLDLNVGRMQAPIQKLTREYTWFVNPFVSVRLLNAAAENYALKEVFDEEDELVERAGKSGFDEVLPLDSNVFI